MLNLSDIISKFHTVAMFITDDLYTTFQTEFLGMFIICLNTKFHIPSYNGPLVFRVKLKAK